MTFEITFAALLRMWTCTDDPQISLVKSFLSQNILRASDSNSHGSVKKASVMTSASQRDRHLSVFLKMTKKIDPKKSVLCSKKDWEIECELKLMILLLLLCFVTSGWLILDFFWSIIFTITILLEFISLHNLIQHFLP